MASSDTAEAPAAPKEVAPQRDHSTESKTAADNLQQSAQVQTSNEVQADRAYWSGKMDKGAGAHLKDMHIDFSRDSAKDQPKSGESASESDTIKTRGFSAKDRADGAAGQTNADRGLSQQHQVDGGSLGKVSGDGAATDKSAINKTATDKNAADKAVGAKAATEPKLDGPFSKPLERGQGPYHSFLKDGKSPEEAAKLGHQVNKETGRVQYKQGESFRVNEDKSVTVREDSKAEKGRYAETTSKDGKTVATKTGDAQGNYEEKRMDGSGKVTSERTVTKAADGTSTDVRKDASGTTTNKFDAQGKQTSSDVESASGAKSGWKKNDDGSVTSYDSPDKNNRTEKTVKDGKVVSEQSTSFNPETGVKVTKQSSDKGGSVETSTGPNAADNYTKSNDGKGNQLMQRADGTGYARTQEPNGSYVEKHYGPNKDDNYSIKGDGKGNTVETREGANGTRTETHKFADSSKDYKAEITPDNKGGWTEKRSYADNTKDHTVVHTPDGKGGYKESFQFKDSKQNYTKEVDDKGKTTFTDNVGLKAEVFGGSPEFQQKAFDEIRKLPEADRKLFAEKGMKFAIAGKMSEIDPSLAGVRPRGWPPGKTWDDADGAYLGGTKQIAVTERLNGGVSDRTAGVVRHEAGHAMDAALGNFSHSDDFQKAIDKDIAKLSPADKLRFSYLLQPNKAGNEEAFADVYGALNGSSTNRSETADVLKSFPNVAEAIKKRMAEKPSSWKWW